MKLIVGKVVFFGKKSKFWVKVWVWRRISWSEILNIYCTNIFSLPWQHDATNNDFCWFTLIIRTNFSLRVFTFTNEQCGRPITGEHSEAPLTPGLHPPGVYGTVKAALSVKGNGQSLQAFILKSLSCTVRKQQNELRVHFNDGGQRSGWLFPWPLSECQWWRGAQSEMKSVLFF